MNEPDITYADARRQARSLFGQTADVAFHVGQLFPARVFVWVKAHSLVIGAGNSYREALEDAKSRQRLPESDKPKTDK